jgi:hypothetical protein
MPSFISKSSVPLYGKNYYQYCTIFLYLRTPAAPGLLGEVVRVECFRVRVVAGVRLYSRRLPIKTKIFPLKGTAPT